MQSKNLIIKRITALILCAVLVFSLCGCDLHDYVPEPETVRAEAVAFDKMQYTRPDVTKLRSLTDEICSKAGTLFGFSRTVKLTGEFFDLYTEYSSMSNIARIRSDLNVSDEYWMDEYAFCSEESGEVNNMVMEICLACAKSPWQRFYDLVLFDGLLKSEYTSDDGEGFTPKDSLRELTRREAELVNEYTGLYAELCADEDEKVYEKYNEQIGNLYIELIKTRREMAKLQNYDSFEALRYYSLGRSYEPEELEDFKAAIREDIVPLYRSLRDSEKKKDAKPKSMSSGEAFSAVLDCTKGLNDTIDEAIEFMIKYGLYDVSDSDSKYEQSYVSYISKYDAPFLFVSPYGKENDVPSIVHELGHFVDDYVNFGADDDIDSSEVFSQALEYLVLGNIKDAELAERLTQYKLFETLTIFSEQAWLDAFETEAYKLSDEELTVENLNDLYLRLAGEYGIEDQSDGELCMEWISVPHFFEYPFYVISYCVSNTAAFSLYQKELSQKGSGLETYMRLMDGASVNGFLTLMDAVRLPSPISKDTVRDIADTLEKMTK